MINENQRETSVQMNGKQLTDDDLKTIIKYLLENKKVCPIHLYIYIISGFITYEDIPDRS